MPQTLHARDVLDRRLAPWRAAAATAPPPPRGWVRAIREALGMSVSDFARRLGVSRQRAAQIEDAELDGSITLASLRRAAEALDCALVFTLVPHGSLEDVVQQRAHEIATRDAQRIRQTMLLENQAVPKEDDRLVAGLEEALEGSRRLWRD